jgi:hypothetical protein
MGGFLGDMFIHYSPKQGIRFTRNNENIGLGYFRVTASRSSDAAITLYKLNCHTWS